MLQSGSRLRSPRPGRCGGRQERERAVGCRRQVSTPLPWTLDTAEGPGMKSPQSECKVHRGDLDQVHLAEKHRGLSLHNPAGTGAAPAAPGLQLAQKGPLAPGGAEQGLSFQVVWHTGPPPPAPLPPACWEMQSFSLSRIPPEEHPSSFFWVSWARGGVRHPPSLASGGIAASETCGTTGPRCLSWEGVPLPARPGQAALQELAQGRKGWRRLPCPALPWRH